VAADLYAGLETSRLVAVLLAPLLPELSARMLSQLDQPPLLSEPGTAIAGAWEAACCWGNLPPGQPLPEPSPVMQRLDLDGPL
jgi:methionyl-tRNA synthetase